MRSVVKTLANLFGYVKDPDSPSNSEDDDDWGDDNPRITMITEQLEYYFSGINLEKDKNFRKEIEESEDGSVSVDYFLKCNRMKYLQATEAEILEAGHNSQYLESNNEDKTIRSKEPFVSDPDRAKRIIRVKGLGKKVPQYAQIEFFNSIFPGEVDYLYLLRVEKDGELDYSNVSLVEFTTPETVKQILENGIVYGSNMLDIQPYSFQNNKNKHQKHHHHQTREQEEQETNEENEEEEEQEQKNEEEESDPDYVPKNEQEEQEEVSVDHEDQEDVVSDEAQQEEVTRHENEVQQEDEVEKKEEKEEVEKQEDEEEVEKQEEEEAEEKPASKRRTPKKKGGRGRSAKPRARE